MRSGKHTQGKFYKDKKNQKIIGKRVESPEVSRIMRTLKRRNRAKKIRNRTCILLALIFVACMIFLFIWNFNESKIKKDNEIIKNSINEFTDVKEQEDTSEIRINKVKVLQNENSDIVGWLEIKGTNISYPVLQGEDNSYYMNHNYKKEKSTDGSLFLDASYDWEKPSSNLLVYGHNNRGSKEMFVELLNYKDENFYKEHQTIRFTTATEDAEYEIISTFLSRVYYKYEEDVFRYYFFIDAENEEEFNEYVDNSKKASLYDIEATASYGDQLLTLSTCEYSQEDGRFAVVARKVKK